MPGPVLSVMDDPMTVLVFALIVGFVQILVGMIVKFWMLCRAGQVWDAIWDIGTWWVIFVGIGLFALNMTGISSVGSVAGYPAVLIIGCVMLLAQARTAKGFGKVTAVISAVYNGVTGYFGDILSYSRLMVMMLAARSSARCSISWLPCPAEGCPPRWAYPFLPHCNHRPRLQHRPECYRHLRAYLPPAVPGVFQAVLCRGRTALAAPEY